MLSLRWDNSIARNQLRLIGPALTDFTRSNCHYMAGGIAYWTLFSLFPLALAAFSILGYVYPTAEEQARMVDGIVQLVPVSEDYLSTLIQDVTRARGTLGMVAVVGLLWTGTSVFSAVRKGINHAWHVRRPAYFLLERAIDLAMLLGVAALAFVHVLFTTDLLGISSVVGTVSETDAWWVIRAFFEIVALAVTIGAFVLLYRFVPHTRVEWRDVWLGSVLGATMFHLVRLGFAWFMTNFGSFNLVYGSLGAVMAVLVWAYLSSMAIMLGAQVTYTYCLVFGSRAGELALPEPKRGGVKSIRGRGLGGIAATLISWLLPPDKRDES